MTTNPTTPDHAALRGRLEHLLRSLGRGGAGLGFNADLHEEAVVDAILLDPGVRAALAATPEPPTADATPTTEAAERLADYFSSYVPPAAPLDSDEYSHLTDLWEAVVEALPRIEAEAASRGAERALAAVKKRVERLPTYREADWEGIGDDTQWVRFDTVKVAAVLAAIEEESHA